MVRHGWRFPPERRHVLSEEGRRERLPPEPILAAANIRPGETVIDLGAGTGYWITPLVQLVRESGRVFAVDVEPVMVDELRELVRREGLANVQVVQSEELSVPLESALADLALLAFVLHEPADVDAFLREVGRLLRPSGRVLVLDWQKHPTEYGPPLEHRLAPKEAKSLLTRAGFAVESVASPNTDFYILLGRRVPNGE
jgi:ubiquinone/menaquinone biosynthesis C-methylase UbiE